MGAIKRSGAQRKKKANQIIYFSGLVHSGRPFRTSVRAAAACFPRNLACVGNVFKLSLQTIFRQIAAKAQRSSLHDALDQGARARRVASKPYTW